MPVQFDQQHAHFWIRLLCREDKFPRLLDMYSFLYDFNLLYEISRIATDPNYEGFEHFDLLHYSGQQTLTTVLRDQDRLYVERMSKESPLELITVVAAVPAAIGAIWGVVQVVEKIVNFRLNRKKLEEEIKKLERENSAPPEILPPVDAPEQLSILYQNTEFLEARLRERDIVKYYEKVGERLMKARIQIVDVDIQIHRKTTK